jgi:superfamily II RNA helicase
MPARTTVISSLSKRTDQGHRLLHASEFLQMAGRAGRRGMDNQGYVVTLQTKFEGVKEACHLATAEANPLVSQFTPSYGMVLNLLQTHTLAEAKELVERSFGRYLALLTLKPQQEAITQLEVEVEHLRQEMQGIDWKQLDQYDKLKGRLKEEKRLLKTLQQQAGEQILKDMGMALAFAVAGTILSLKGKHVPVPHPLPAVLVAKAPGAGQFPYLVCLGANNHWYVVTTQDVVGLHGELSRIAEVDHLQLPPDLLLKPGQIRGGKVTTQPLAQKLVVLAQRYPLEVALGDGAEEVRHQMARTEAVQEQLTHHPAHQWQGRNHFSKKRQRLDRLESDLLERQTKLERQSQRHWQEFSGLMEILQDFDALAQVTPTPLGEAVAALRGENELWLGLALYSGKLDHLAPHHLAAACQALVTDLTRPDLWVNYEPPSEVTTALGSLRSIRRRIFQVQQRRQVSLPISYELGLTGLITEWALQVEWPELCNNTSLDDGDIVRVLRRTLDLLHQIPHVPHLSDNLKRNASRAIYLIDRFPVREAVEITNLEILDEPGELDGGESVSEDAESMPPESGLPEVE